MQDTFLLQERGEAVRGLQVIKALLKIYRTFTTMFTGCRLTETIYLTTFFLILKVG